MLKARYHDFRPFNASLMGFAPGSPEDGQERIGHALTAPFTLDVYAHTLDWKANEEGATSLGMVIAKAVTEAESNLDSGPATAHNEEGSNLGVWKPQEDQNLLLAGTCNAPLLRR